MNSPVDVIVVPKADGEGLTDGAIERQARMTGIARVVVEIECENTGVGAELPALAERKRTEYPHGRQWCIDGDTLCLLCFLGDHIELDACERDSGLHAEFLLGVAENISSPNTKS